MSIEKWDHQIKFNNKVIDKFEAHEEMFGDLIKCIRKQDSIINDLLEEIKTLHNKLSEKEES